MVSLMTIQSTLDRLNQAKAGQAAKPTAPLYSSVAPKELSFDPQDIESFYKNLQTSTVNTYRSQKAIEDQMQQNLEQQKAMERERRAYEQAQRNYVSRGKQKQVRLGGSVNYSPGSFSKGNVSGVGVGKNLRTMSFHGIRYTVNASVAGRFQGFLKALYAKGYRPRSIGGYSNRNIAGTGTKSLHAYGMAIDIDPSRNPIYYNGRGGRHGLPSNVGALAAKYGLSWGGNWRNTKDYMHFSVPYGGRM